MIYSFLQCGDNAVTVQFEKKIDKDVNAYVTSLCSLVSQRQIKGVIETVPAFCSLTVVYDCTVISSASVKRKLKKLISNISLSHGRKAVVYNIPVCYDGEFAPDMENVSNHTGLTKEEIIKIHSGKPYLIYMLGFLPGFAYLGGLDERLHTPRLETPRVEIFEGAVGIGGAQTGIYPVASPGGWQLIGRTPVKIYDVKREKPILYEAGDCVSFFPVSAREYEEIKINVENGSYNVETGEVSL